MYLIKSSNLVDSVVNRKTPIRLMLFFFVFIYIFQYPVSLLISGEPESRFNFSSSLLFESYLFILFSVVIFFIFFYFGSSMSRKKVNLIFSKSSVNNIQINHLSFILLISFFLLWTLIMLKLKIGMTIFVDFEPLPFRITGILFYGRLILQPIILSFFCFKYSYSKHNYFVFFFIFLLGLAVSISSGSRFASVMFSIPVLLLFKGNFKFVFFSFTLFIYILSSSLSRHFVLPYIIGGDYIELYANEIYQESITKDLILLPFQYLVFRIMGISEVMMTLNIDYPSSFLDGFWALFSYFIPFLSHENVVSAKTVYGLDDEVFGGFGLDAFSNYWLFFGRNIISYFFGLSFCSFLFGRTYAFASIFFQKLNFKEGELIVFILLFLFFIEGRSFLFPVLFIMSYFLYKLKFPTIEFVKKANVNPNLSL